MEQFLSNSKITEKEFYEAVNRVFNALKNLFKIPGYEDEDIKQEILKKALECVGMYNGQNKTHANFHTYLHSAARNHLFNIRHSVMFRPVNPCRKCFFWSSTYKKCASKEELQEKCKHYQKYEQDIRSCVFLSRATDDLSPTTGCIQDTHHKELIDDIVEKSKGMSKTLLKKTLEQILQGEEVDPELIAQVKASVGDYILTFGV